MATDRRTVYQAFEAPELLERLRTLPFHMATLLVPKNLERARALGFGRLVRQYFRLSLGDKAKQLCEVITGLQGTERFVSTLRQVGRHRFVRPRQRHLAYLDASLRAGRHCYLSEPTLVAVMLETASLFEDAYTVMELGAGTGFHAECVRKVMRPSSLLSVELEANMKSACSIVQSLGLDPTQVISPAAAQARLGSVDYLYATAALTVGQVDDLCGRLPASTVVTLPRQMTKDEFLRRRQISTNEDVAYSAYRTSMTWNHDVVLETRTAGTGQQIRADFGVRFMKATVDGHIVR